MAHSRSIYVFVILSALIIILAAFYWSQFSLIVSIKGQGSVSMSPEQVKYTYGSSVTLTATPASGWVFADWSGDILGNMSQTTLMMNGNKAITANFARIQYTLDIKVTGMGTTTPSAGSRLYNQSSKIQLTATPEAGWSFEYWVLDNSSTLSVNPFIMTMNKTHTLEAVFTSISVLENDFVETCDTWDLGKWFYYLNPPMVSGGTWVFDFPMGFKGIKQAVYLQPTGYGIYSIKFKTSFTRPFSGLAWYSFFLYGDTKNELDIPEFIGSHQSKTTTIVTHRYVEGVQTGYKYWYFSSPITFEDGDWHIMEFEYSADVILFRVDGILTKVIEEDESTPIFPVGPMRLMLGVGSDGLQTQPFSLVIDMIEYHAPI